MCFSRVSFLTQNVKNPHNRLFFPLLFSFISCVGGTVRWLEMANRTGLKIIWPNVYFSYGTVFLICPTVWCRSSLHWHVVGGLPPGVGTSRDCSSCYGISTNYLSSTALYYHSAAYQCAFIFTSLNNLAAASCCHLAHLLCSKPLVCSVTAQILVRVFGGLWGLTFFPAGNWLCIFTFVSYHVGSY